MTLLVTPIHNLGSSAEGLRKLLRQTGGLQPGVFGDAFKVSQNASPNTSVSIASGWATVAGNADNLYAVRSDATVTTQTGGAAGHATLPRIDRVILKVYDKTDLGSSVDGGQVFIRQGVASSSATLDTPIGAAAVGPGELLLADMLMPAAGTTYTSANIRDRRAWARGFNALVAGDGSGNQVTTSTSFANVAGHTIPRFELSAGNGVEIQGSAYVGGAAAGGLIRVPVGGVSIHFGLASGTQSIPIYTQHFGLTAGSYSTTVQAAANTGGQSFTITNSGSILTRINIREVIGGRQEN